MKQAPTIPSLRRRLRRCMIADRRVLWRRLRALERDQDSGQLSAAAVENLAERVERSVALAQRRRDLVPNVSYPEELPVSARRREIIEAIGQNQVVVVCGETGSGKTTQLPKMCLELGRGVLGRIGHTQPRRIAARSVSARIAEELGVTPGSVVGSKVRFGDHTGPDTLVKLMTDGILLSETQSDPGLAAYDTIIIDEAHERSLNIDFLLGYLHRLLPRRHDLKLIITSATIDPGRFSRHFWNAPIIEVSGRTYPVDVRYRPLAAQSAGDEAIELEDGVVRAVEEIGREVDGDVLVFMSGEREIRQAAKALRDSFGTPGDVEILPLYARLSMAEQQRVFKPHRGRRIVIATNVAETSLTVPGIKAVVDPGEARISRYSARTKVQGLQIEPISRASADQRAGRCGRIAPGVCIRLYSQRDYESREPYTPPEILRTNLASVVLQMKALNLGRPEDFPFLEPPDSRQIRDGYETLLQLGAMTEDGELTEVGRRLARLPIDPRIGRMILAAADEDCLGDVLIIASGLSVQDPRDRPHEKREQADQAHQQFAHPESDFLSYLNIWHFYHEQERHLSRSKLSKALLQNFLSPVRMREWRDVLYQLREMCAEMDLHPKTAEADHGAIHRALLTGLLPNVGRRTDTFEYEGTRSTRFHIFPGSVLFKSRPKWVMSAEIVRTTRLYARCVAGIEPQWIETVGAHLLRRQYQDAYWDERQRNVMARERITMLGLEIVGGRPVPYGPVEPAKAREIFIHEALVGGAIDIDPPALAHNRELAERVRAMEARARRDDLLADAQARYAFYDARLPEEVHSTRGFERWLRRAERSDPRILYMSPEDLLLRVPEPMDHGQFPEQIVVDGVGLNLSYRHQPGKEDDGVTVTVPVEFLGQIDRARLDWLVPGMVEEKIAALIRTLPKSLRRNFDAGATARELAPRLEIGKRPMVDALASALSELAGVTIPRDAFKPDEIDAHLWMRYSVVDAGGRELAAGRDLGELRQRLSKQIAASYAHAGGSEFERDDLLDWDFGHLPEQIEIRRGAYTLVGYPTLIDEGQTVSLRVLSSRLEARRRFRAGLARLYVRHLREEFKYYARHLPDIERMTLHYAQMGDVAELKRDLLLLVADRVFIGDDQNIRTREQFAARLDTGWNLLRPTVERVCGQVGRILARFHALALRLAEPSPEAWNKSLRDVRAHLGRLLPPRFLTVIPYERLEQYPRYLRAVERRVERLREWGPARDIEMAKQAARWQEAYDQRQARHEAEGVYDPHLDAFRWLIEEYRVSLFAQELGTVEKVSDQRLARRWEQVRS
ncbi:MAG: ATP-dependent RNA helicase HrpA [Phycisphaerales bacterium]|nr:ATP-dependent RNA helicase HrpA [Phycisphaerales bacterium]